MDATSADGLSAISEVSPSSSEGFPMYVTGGGDSEEITVTSRSDEFCSRSSELLWWALLSLGFCSSWSRRSGRTTAIGCPVVLVSGAAEREKTMALVDYHLKRLFVCVCACVCFKD